jgi:hypothetical protein
MLDADNIDELVERAKDYLKKSKSVDLRLFVNQQAKWELLRDPNVLNMVADKLRQSSRYKLTNGNFGEFTFIVTKTSWAERNPHLFTLLVAFIGAALALITQWLLSQKETQEQNQRDTQQETRLNNLSDSLTNLERNTNDSVNVLNAELSRVWDSLNKP